MSEDEKYMHRCIQLAQNGVNGAAPNPMVGAVVVHEGRIIGEGYHIRCGGPHAEVNAIRSVKDERLLAKSTIYVSLEPCSHYGKTPPCADLIISKRIPRVVVGCMDPFAQVCGRGIQKLRDAGIEVAVGILEQECLRLNRKFMTFNRRHRPYVTLKWAESADGFIDRDRTEGEPVVLSTPLTRMTVHRQRSEHKAILVGRRTALLDNPSLTVREWIGANPLRLVIDKDLILPHRLHLFDGTTPTWVFTAKANPSTEAVRYVQLDFGRDILAQMMESLYEAKVQSLLVEGGSQLLQSFIDAELWDEIYIERSPLRLGSGVPSPNRSRIGHTPEVEQRFGRTFFVYRR